MVGMWDQYKNLSVEAQDIGDAIAETEQEIFDSAFDNAPDDNDFSDDLEQVEGFDGEPLSDDDVLEGPNENGYDRPASLRRDEDLMARNEQLEQERQQLAARLDQLENGPERQAQFRQAARDMLYEKYGVLPTDDRVDGLVNEMLQSNAVVQNMQNSRFNESMGRAHREHGPDFERAFEYFRSLPDTPANRAIAQEVWNAPNPGERLMALGPGMAGLGSTRGLHPDLGLAGARTSPVRSGGGRDDFSRADIEAHSLGIRDVENDIARSAWDN